MSREFAERVALVLNGNGIKTFLYSELQPTPILSFSVRELGAIAGVVITASHNPPEYNGYKVYWEDGAQITLGRANDIIQEIDKIQDFDEIKDIPREVALKEGLLNIIGEEVLEKYFDKVKNLIHNPSLIEKMDDSISIIYTPLHGSGNKPVRRALKMAGFKNVTVVTEQELPDPEFSTVGYPNPEEERVFELAIGMAKARNNETDIIIGTDPDCDRVGVVAKNASGEYVMLTGNQIGALLTDYILGARKRADKLPQNGTIIKTIVTSRMGERIAQAYGVGVIDTLTGFKFIGEKIKNLKRLAAIHICLGTKKVMGTWRVTLSGTRMGFLLPCLSVKWQLLQVKGMTLHDALIDLWNKYGYFYEELRSIEMEGKEGMERIQELMGDFRNDPPKELAGIRISVIDDYMDSKSYNLKRNHIYYRVTCFRCLEIYPGGWVLVCHSSLRTEPR